MTAILIYAVILLGVLGAAIGSFLNVVVYRVPQGLSIVHPPSACPACGHAIRARDNVPVLSWLVLRGKCRDCRAPISARYPLVESGTAVFFVLVGWWELAGLIENPVSMISTATAVSVALSLAAFLYLAAVSIALALIDLDVHRLPNKIVLPAYVVGAVLLGSAALITGDYDRLIGAGIGLAALWLAYFLMAILYPGGMGFGDVKLAGVIGIVLGWMGWGSLLIGAFAGFLTGAIGGLLMMAITRGGRKTMIPFGPFMLLGGAIGIGWGEQLAEAYLGLFSL